MSNNMERIDLLPIAMSYYSLLFVLFFIFIFSFLFFIFSKFHCITNGHWPTRSLVSLRSRAHTHTQFATAFKLELHSAGRMCYNTSRLLIRFCFIVYSIVFVAVWFGW